MKFTPAVTPPAAGSVALVEATRTSSTISLDVVATSINGVASVYFDLVFNPAVLQFSSGTVGAFLGSSGKQVNFLLPVDLPAANAAGRLPVGVSISPANGSVSGTGTVCTLIFSGVAAGGSNLSFEAAAATTPFPVEPIPGITFSGGSVSVTR